MRKILKNMAAVAVLAFGLASCGQGNDDSRLSSDNSDNAQADSLITCFGQLRGAEFLREAQKDTTLATEEARQAYLEGVRTGLKAVKDNNDAYNRGVFLGMQMAMNMQQFNQAYGIKLSEKIFIESLAKTIEADSVGNREDLQREFYGLMNRFNSRKEERDSQAAAQALKAEADKTNLVMIASQLYGQAPDKNAPLLKDGDTVDFTTTVKKDGRAIEAPLPRQLTIGERLKTSPMTAALKTMSPGQTATFLTTAHALFGQRCQQLKLEPDQVLTLEITVNR